MYFRYYLTVFCVSKIQNTSKILFHVVLSLHAWLSLGFLSAKTLAYEVTKLRQQTIYLLSMPYAYYPAAPKFAVLHYHSVS
jgi:hypothetical protein